MKALTAKQSDVLSFIRTYVGDHKYPPTIREIAGNYNISVKGAYDHVKALEKKGKVKTNKDRSRALEIIDDEEPDNPVVDVPLLGHVAAGLPVFSDENYDGSIKLPADQLKTGPHFALNVRGDSMTGAGILDGDVAVFIKQNVAANGDIVVARIDDEAVTLKRFFKEKNRIKLQAENESYPPLYTQNARILGKLACIIRNYN